MDEQELYVYTRYRKQANTKWEGDTFYHANMYLVDNLCSLKMCHKCFQLYGSIRLQDRQRVEQRCYCHRPNTEERWHISGNGYDVYYDFNQDYEICYCCGLEIIPSGSRWSSFYCQDCKGRIRKLNERIAVCIIPYGRHSLMNGISLSGESVKDNKAITDFVLAANRMNQTVEIIGKHRETIAKAQTDFLGLDKDAPAIDLILKSHGSELDEPKEEAFLKLAALVFNRTTDETGKFYFECLRE